MMTSDVTGNSLEATSVAGSASEHAPGAGNHARQTMIALQAERHPLSWIAWAPVIAIVVLADICLYQGEGGFRGWSVFLGGTGAVVALARRPRNLPWWLVCNAVLVAAVMRLAWQGNVPVILFAILTLTSIGMCSHGFVPFIPRVFVGTLTVVLWGIWTALESSFRRPPGHGAKLLRFSAAVVLPIVVCAAFVALFVLANPQVSEWMQDQASVMVEKFSQWLQQFTLFQCLLWGVVGAAMFGWLAKPPWNHRDRSWLDSMIPQSSEKSSWYSPLRNTLVCVSLLFVVYLIFEFSTLWFREFPEGFYYAGYAHQGAFWLTVALALTTLTLGLSFRGSILTDPRSRVLRWWAGGWSLCNVLLGASVYNRMLIYIDFNGMTRMRIVGLYGITCVLVGFILVVYKIKQRKSFYWLIQSQLWALIAFLFLLSITPMDSVAHRYNVSRIMRGDLAPSTQIAHHEVSDEGYCQLIPLLDCEDPILRDGIAVMLAERLKEMQGGELPRWSDRQWSRQRLEALLDSHREELKEWQGKESEDHEKRKVTRDAFLEYTYQWY